MELDLDRLPPEKTEDFFEYFRAELRKYGWSRSGSVGVDEDRIYRLKVDSDLPLNDEEVTVTWRLAREPDGRVSELTADASEAEGEDWQEAARKVFEDALEATLAGRTEEFFQRTPFTYLGQALDGEYWLGNFRFAPVEPEDETPASPMLERVVVIDQEIDAIDHEHAATLAATRSKHLISILALVLDVPFKDTEPGIVWVLAPEEDRQEGEFPYQRATRALPYPAAKPDRMPDKGEMCSLGEYEGSLSDPYRTRFPRLSLPEETQDFFQAVDQAPADLRERLEHCTHLYRLGLLIHRWYPTAAITYLVAAVDSLNPGGQGRGAVTEFVTEHVQVTKGSFNLDAFLKFLYGEVRSKHLHVGNFPLGDFLGQTLELPDADRLLTGEQFRQAHAVLRSTILTWVGKNFLSAGPVSER